MSKLKDALEAVKDTVSDFSSLEVQTYTGSAHIMQQVVQRTESGELKFTDLFKNASINADLKLRLVTKYNIDGDAINLVSEETLPEHVITAHDAAVAAGQDLRKGMLELFTGYLGVDDGNDS